MIYDYKPLLDKRREGQEFSLAEINRALQDAGDLEPDRSERLDTPIPIESERTGSTGNEELVGSCEVGHQQTAWAGWSRYLDCIDGETT